MSDKMKPQKNKLLVNVRGLLLGLCLVLGVGIGFVYAADDTSDNRKLQNGSFEEEQTFTGN